MASSVKTRDVIISTYSLSVSTDLFIYFRVDSIQSKLALFGKYHC